MANSKEFIFKKNNGKLEFVGDFEGFYKADNDPWCQSGQGDMSVYYQNSRQRILEKLRKAQSVDNIIEIGCGLGHFTAQIKESFKTSNVYGVDISETAIKKATERYKSPYFLVGNAKELSKHFPIKKVDVILLNQLLWYIVDDLEEVLQAIKFVLDKDGVLIISNAFAREQQYGLEKLPYFDGAQRYFANIDGWTLTSAEFYDDGETHTDGHFILQLSKY